MVYKFPTNADFDSWVSSSKPKTVKQYVDWTMLITVSKKVCLLFMMGILFKVYFLVYRHETPEVAEGSNKEETTIQQRFQAILHLVVYWFQMHQVCFSYCSDRASGSIQEV
jgi:hypothetical protein